MNNNNIDINCDLGEGLSYDGDLMQYISSCNIACGGHTGNIKTMDKTIALAVANDVKIGIHPSYPDKENFGRKVIDITDEDLKQSLTEQISLFLERLSLQNAELHHLKPHGALYNVIAKDAQKAQIVIDVIKALGLNTILYVPYNSEIEHLAIANNIPIQYEVFIDRRYNEDGSLVSRKEPNAVIYDNKQALDQVVNIVNKNQILSVSDKWIPTQWDTFCIHGDNEHSLSMLAYLHEYLKNYNISIS